MYAHYDDRDLAVLLQRAHVERAEAVRRFIVGIGPGLAAAGRKSLSIAVGLARKLEAWQRARAAAAELRALDDRSLKDIGVYRSDIPRIAEAVAVGIDPRPPLRVVPGVRPAPVVQLPQRKTLPERRAA